MYALGLYIFQCFSLKKDPEHTSPPEPLTLFARGCHHLVRKKLISAADLDASEIPTYRLSHPGQADSGGVGSTSAYGATYQLVPQSLGSLHFHTYPLDLLGKMTDSYWYQLSESGLFHTPRSDS